MNAIRITTSVSGLLATLLAGQAALGQSRDAALSRTANEEIVVTALKRTQALIDVPQSVSVVGGAALERQQAFNFQDYAKLIPGLQLAQSNPGEARIVLRGINTGGVASTVATYVDETPFGSSSGQINGAILAGEFDTFDVARVEVLRGPQGTLYGASSLGGVIKFVTNAPSTERFEGRARASVETVDKGQVTYMGSAMVNVPVSDNLAIRASGFYRRYGGFIDSNGQAGSDVAKNTNQSKSYGGRISALFKPAPNVSLRLTAILQDLNSDASNVVDADPVTLKIAKRYVQSEYVPEITDVRYRVYNGTINADLGFATLTSSTSYSTLKEHLRDDNTVLYGSLLGLYSDATGPIADIGLPQNTDVSRFTEEVRLASDKNEHFEWLVGGYYDHEKGKIQQRLEAYEHGTLTPFAAIPLLFDGANPSRYEEFAGFANGTLHLGRRFDLTFGGRYSHNDQDARQFGTGLLAPPTLSSSSKENVFTWSAAPKIKLGDRVSLYARVAKGFRPGGPNIVPPGAPTDIKTYKSDSLISYEAGIKAETADRSFTIDAAVFHIDWKRIQLFALIQDFGVNANGGKAKSNGVEFTATLRPTRGLEISANGAYTDAKLREDTDLTFIGGRDGDRLPFTPRYAVSVNGDYDWKIGERATAFVGASARFLSEQSGPFSPYSVALTGHQFRIPSYTTVDVRAGVDFGRFSIEAYAKNIANTIGITNVVGTPAGLGQPSNYPFGRVGAAITRPRSFGVTLGAGF